MKKARAWGVSGWSAIVEAFAKKYYPTDDQEQMAAIARWIGGKPAPCEALASRDPGAS